MAQIPAFCDNCGCIFPSAFAVSDSLNINISNSRSTCPNCGSLAKTISGNFNVIEETIEIIKASKWTIEKINHYKTLIQKLEESKASFEEVKCAIEKNAPELKGLLSEKQKDMITLFSFLFAFIAIIQSFITNDKQPTTVINNNITNIYQYTPPASTKKIQRNDLCGCGSGEKFKKCHGKTN